jgi:hypothetical protein
VTSAAELIDRSIPFLEEIKDRTTGEELEIWLNTTYGPGSASNGRPPTTCSSGYSRHSRRRRGNSSPSWCDSALSRIRFRR